ncbi:hypothetical protein JD793_001938 [Citrobacter braakii]|uniref:T6SS effector BTH_I2691 family protein n=1 Tax=Citrobacter sp. RHBSTW-00570 TaxID=2742655 RepID=UPI00080C5452|nr:T6SS effector BTH_I2691 family protein [Citrobacter sp. RHBSTW-00570]EGT5655819.1 hypothetical protein [Citrobacter braakii]OCF81260.1 hypothetical protein AS299_06770 [Citrobacter freundii]QLV67128.1 hypothetical protein HV237_03900 [Citrobacter sp. RHBSTW-00570]
MNTEQGCKFCRRYGLPVLLARPAVMAADDSLPLLPADITVSVPVQGQTAYTARLLRAGFLNIWSESGARWINYYVTNEGYYYPLPENGDVPADIVDGTRKPCVNKPEELATASLITLPVKPAGMKNGVFWFGWSEVEWTDATRKKHEDATYRSQYMQGFDMDAWVNGGSEKQALPISGLANTLAEYSPKAASCSHKTWSPAPFRNSRPHEGQNLIQAADALYAGKGAILVLADPVAVAQDISALSNHRIEKQFSQNPKYSRGLALSSALSSLKEVLCTQFERDQLTLDSNVEKQAEGGIAVQAGVMLPSMASAQHSALYSHNNQSLPQQVNMYWAQYEKYIDRTKEQAFLKEYDAALSAYDQQVISPMVNMYLAWLQGQTLLNYLDSNFDPEDIGSGALFTQTVMYCVQHMQNKSDVTTWFMEQLSQPSISETNILLRATVLNNTQWTLKVSEVVSTNKDYSDVPWKDKLIDFYTKIMDKEVKSVQFALEGYLNAVSSALAGMLDKAADRLLPSLVALAASYGMGLKVISSTGERKYFISAIVRQLGEMTDLDSRISASRLRHYVDIEVRRMEIAGVSMVGIHQQKSLVLIDVAEATQTRALPEAERASAAAKTMRSADEVSSTLFSRQWREKLAQAKGSTVNNLANDGAQILPFAGCVFAMIMQVGAVSKSASSLMKGQLSGAEKVTKFIADTIGAGGTLLDAAERVIFKFKSLRLKSLVRLSFGRVGAVGLEKGLQFAGRACAAFGFVAVGWDFYHFIDEVQKGNMGMATAYFISAAAGGTLVAAAVFPSLVLGPIGLAIAIAFVLGSAIYIAMKNRDEIQKWLAATWWRQIPDGESEVPAVWPTMQMEMSQLQQLVGGRG